MMVVEEQTAAPLSFTPVIMSQKDQIEAIRSKSGNKLYTYTFTTLFTWKNTEQYEIYITDDAYLVKNGARGDNAYLFPCGSTEGRIRLIDTLLTYEKPVFFFVSDADKVFLEQYYPERFRYEECRDDYPYLYDKDSQITLKGSAYRKLRHWVNKGRRMADTWKIEPLTGLNIHRARSINQIWSEKRDVDGLTDYESLMTALEYFDELDMWGLLFQADGKDVAYVAGSFITPEIFDVNFCKVSDRNLDCYIKWLLYQELPSEVKTVDSEEDMGLEGLRTHKLLRIPKELTRVWKGSLLR